MERVLKDETFFFVLIFVDSYLGRTKDQFERSDKLISMMVMMNKE